MSKTNSTVGGREEYFGLYARRRPKSSKQRRCVHVLLETDRNRLRGSGIVDKVQLNYIIVGRNNRKQQYEDENQADQSMVCALTFTLGQPTNPCPEGQREPQHIENCLGRRMRPMLEIEHRLNSCSYARMAKGDKQQSRRYESRKELSTFADFSQNAGHEHSLSVRSISGCVFCPIARSSSVRQITHIGDVLQNAALFRQFKAF